MDPAERKAEARDRLLAREPDPAAEPGVALPPDAEFHVTDPRYCLGCGFDLTELDEDARQCPRCGRSFDPADASTYAETAPPSAEPNYWLEPPRLAGYILVPLFLVGRAVTNAVAAGFGESLGSVGGATVGPLMVVFLLLPWLFICVYLALVLADDYINPLVGVAVGVGAAFGLLFTFGLHPALLVIGLIIGSFAGFVRAWRTM